MPNRVTEATFRSYIVIPSDSSVAQFLDDAHVLVEARMGATPSVGETLATLIEKNLAAHLYVVAREGGGIVKNERGESAETYASPSKDTGLGSTRFGQTVLALDTSGSFADMANSTSRKAQFRIA